ncbi:MAG: hypothetical protein ACI81S_002108 [Sphingobacteriales bacterium]|jgi:hypothetical protein
MKKQLSILLLLFLLTWQTSQAQWEQLNPALNYSVSGISSMDNHENETWIFANNVGAFKYNLVDSSWENKTGGLVEMVLANQFLDFEVENISVNQFGVLIIVDERDPFFYDGEKWEKIETGLPEDTFFFKKSFKLKNELYLTLGKGDKSRIFQLDAGKKEWILKRSNSFPYPQELVFSNDFVIYEHSNVLYISNDLIQFRKLETEPPQGGIVEGFVSDGTNHYQIFWNGTFLPSLFKLNESSKVWENVSNGILEAFVSLSLIDSYLFSWKTTPAPPAAINFSLTNSNNLEWDSLQLSKIPGHYPYGGVSINDSTLMLNFYGTGPVLFNTTTQKFTQVTKNLDASSFYGVERDADGNLYTVSHGAGVKTLRKGKMEWETVDLPNSHLIEQLEFMASDSCIWGRLTYSLFRGPEITHYLSFDFGKTWTGINLEELEINDHRQFQFGGQIRDSLFFYNDYNNDAYITMDKGLSFQKDSTFFPKQNVRFDIFSWKNQYFTLLGSFLYKLENGKWEKFNENILGEPNMFNLVVTDKYLIFWDKDTLYRNQLDGQGWELIPDKNKMGTVKGVDSLIFGTYESSQGVFVSADYGLTFKEITNGLEPFTIQNGVTMDAMGKFWLSTFSYGLYSGSFEEIYASILKDEGESNLSIFPNPTNNFFTINLTEELINGKAFVYNIKGQIILSNEITQSKGVSFDLSHQSPGIYFVQIIDGQNAFLGKVIKNSK